MKFVLLDGAALGIVGRLQVCPYFWGIVGPLIETPAGDGGGSVTAVRW